MAIKRRTMKKIKIKDFSIYEQLYETEIVYLVGGEVEDLIAYIKSKHKDSPLYSWGKRFDWGEDANTTNAYQFHVNAPLGSGEKFYVWMHEVTPSLLYHETFHLAGDILFTRGVEYSYSSEEGYAYLGGWIFEKIFNALQGKISSKK